MRILIRIVNTIVSLLTLLVIIYTFLGYFLHPYHPIKRTMGQVIEPLLAPIRRLVPPVGGLDFSPLILIILLQVIGMLLVALLRSFV